MQIMVEVPHDLSQHPDPAREALEAFAIASYRSGILTKSQIRILLGFPTRYELDGFLKQRNVLARSYGFADLDHDLKGLGL